MTPYTEPKTVRNRFSRNVFRLLGALALSACAPVYGDQVSPEAETSDSVVDGTITWERPEVGTIFIGGGMCTATLITPTVAVTAAHCVDFRTVNRPGSYGRFIVQASASSPQQRYDIDMYRSFGTNGDGDVALVHLATAVPGTVASPAGIAARRHEFGVLRAIGLETGSADRS